MPVDESAVRELAYRLWEARGRRHGDAEQDWLAAERQLAGGGPAAGDVAAGDHSAGDRVGEIAAGDLPGAGDSPTKPKRPAGASGSAQPKRPPPPRRRARDSGNSNSADH